MSLLREEKYVWTNHARMKMRHYRLTEARVKRIIRYPARIEESVVEDAVACMQPSSATAAASEGKPAKNYSEIWAMYVLVKSKGRNEKAKQMKVITAWRYPGHSPERNPVPQEILREIKNLIHAF